jgi:hypothetical protein
MNDASKFSALYGLMLITTSTFAADIVVNGVPLDNSTRQTLERTYGVPILPGQYCYDNVSGV